MGKTLRKQQNHLVEVGTGVILFAVWSVARVNLYLGLSPFSVEVVYDAAAEFGIDGRLFLILLVTILAVVLLWQLCIRLYIGLTAIAEGKGKNKSWFYLVVATVLLVSEVRLYWNTFDIAHILTGERMDLNQIVALCMESASAYVLLELLISGVRLKNMRKKMKA